jgi:hypothetical protein
VSRVEAYRKELARCRELLEVYRSLGPIGAFGHAALAGVLKEAEEAAISGDLPRMVRALHAMKGCE